MNIYLKDGEPVNPAIALGTSPPSGYTISPDPTLDWDVHAEILIAEQETTATIIRDAIAIEYTSITWASGSAEQKIIWSKWFVATISERDEEHDATEQNEFYKILTQRINLNVDDESAQGQADLLSDKEPGEIDDKFGDKGLTKLIDFSYPTIYSTTQSGFAAVPIQVVVPFTDDVHAGKTVKAKLAIDHYLESGVDAEFELYNYTDLESVTGSQFSTIEELAWLYAIGPCVVVEEGKSYRLRMRRTAGSGNNAVLIEAAQIIISYE